MSIMYAILAVSGILGGAIIRQEFVSSQPPAQRTKNDE